MSTVKQPPLSIWTLKAVVKPSKPKHLTKINFGEKQGKLLYNYEHFCWCVNYRIPDGKPPRFPKKPTIKQKGELLVMECILEAAPLPEITWWQGTKQITESGRIKMLRKDVGKDTYMLSLEISNPVIGDGGSWRCNAVNACGESNANISLNFQGTHSHNGQNSHETSLNNSFHLYFQRQTLSLNSNRL